MLETSLKEAVTLFFLLSSLNVEQHVAFTKERNANILFKRLFYVLNMILASFLFIIAA